MKKKLFNIHKLIGINIILVFFLSLFFGILTIYRPYVSLWENKASHFKAVEIENINLDKCVKEVKKRRYFGENGKVDKNDFITLSLPNTNFLSNNLINVKNRNNFNLHPKTCKKIKDKSFSIAKFFDNIHYGRFFSIFTRIIFGFASVAVVFLCLSGMFLVFKNNYSNKKTTSSKAFFAKYHRLILFYTMPLVFILSVTGALFNLGVYSSPVITSYLSKGKTSNILAVERNILYDKPLKIEESTEKVKAYSLNILYDKAKKEFSDASFYQMDVYNYSDIKAKVKFIAYENDEYFISSVYNESYIVYDMISAKVLDKKTAKDGSFTEKTLDSIFYLHYLRTFHHLPRHVFALICLFILIGMVFAITLWLQRAKKDKFSYKILRPLSFSIILGSLLGSSFVFASTWVLPKKYMFYNLNNVFYSSQETLFFISFFLVFLLIILKNNLFKVSRYVLLISSLLLLSSVISHSIKTSYTFVRSYKEGLEEIFIMDIALLFTSFTLIFLFFILKEKYFEGYNKKG